MVQNNKRSHGDNVKSHAANYFYDLRKVKEGKYDERACKIIQMKAGREAVKQAQVKNAAIGGDDRKEARQVV